MEILFILAFWILFKTLLVWWIGGLFLASVGITVTFGFYQALLLTVVCSVLTSHMDDE